jgi:hypothetical protein
MFGQGYCSGVVEGILFYRDEQSFCLPKGVTLGQAAAVVVKHIENNPATWHLKFIIVAEVALMRAFPCKK